MTNWIIISNQVVKLQALFWQAALDSKKWKFEYDQVTNYLENMIFSEKIIGGPHEGVTPPPLAQMVLTQCASISELLVHHMAPPGGQI